MKDRDVLSAHVQPDPQLLVADTKTADVIVGVAPWGIFLFSNNLSVHDKTYKK